MTLLINHVQGIKITVHSLDNNFSQVTPREFFEIEFFILFLKHFGERNTIFYEKNILRQINSKKKF